MPIAGAMTGIDRQEALLNQLGNWFSIKSDHRDTVKVLNKKL